MTGDKWLLALMALLGGCSARPSDEALIGKFKSRKAAFERLRDMILEDDNLRRVADWGVELDHPVGTSKPPASSFPLERYKRYLGLLAEADGVGASRSASARGTIACVLVWAAGWAGDAQHASICWVPGGQGSNARGRRHIEQDWYLEKDFTR